MKLNLTAIQRGGMLARKKPILTLGLLLAPPAVAYLTGDIDLKGLVLAVVQALVGL